MVKMVGRLCRSVTRYTSYKVWHRNNKKCGPDLGQTERAGWPGLFTK